MTQYQWVIQERNGEQIGEIHGLTGRRIAMPLNRPPEASASLRVSSSDAIPQMITSGTTELVIYRDGAALDTVFHLSNVSITGNASGQTVELSWLGAMSYLQYGLVLAGTTYSATAQSRIVWDAISDFQARTGATAYGLTDAGAPTSDPTKSVTYEEDTDLLEAIIALSERDDGFDFSVDSGRRFVCHYPQRGTDRTGTARFTYGVNVDSFQLDQDTAPGSIVTDVRVSGGPGTAVTTATDAAAQGVYGRREASIQYSDVITSVSALQEHADSVVAERSRPQAIPKIVLRQNHPSTPWGSYDVGDTVLVQIRAGELVDINDPYRIVQIGIDLDDNDNENIALDLNEAVL